MKVERVVKSSSYSSVCSLTRYPHNEATGKKTQHHTRRTEDAACCQEFITMTRNTNVRRGWHLLVWPNQSPVILWAELEGTVHSRPQRSVDLKQFCEEQRSKLGWKRLIEVIAAKRKFNQRLNPTIHFLFHLHCSSLTSELNTTCCLSASVGWRSDDMLRRFVPSCVWVACRRNTFHIISSACFATQENTRTRSIPTSLEEVSCQRQ